MDCGASVTVIFIPINNMRCTWKRVNVAIQILSIHLFCMLILMKNTVG